MNMSAVRQAWPKPTCKTANWVRRQDRQKKRWEDNVREWTSLEFAKSQRAVENREKKWRKVVVKSSVVPEQPLWLRGRWWWPACTTFVQNTTQLFPWPLSFHIAHSCDIREHLIQHHASHFLKKGFSIWVMICPSHTSKTDSVSGTSRRPKWRSTTGPVQWNWNKK